MHRVVVVRRLVLGGRTRGRHPGELGCALEGQHDNVPEALRRPLPQKQPVLGRLLADPLAGLHDARVAVGRHLVPGTALDGRHQRKKDAVKDGLRQGDSGVRGTGP